ncbi:MAG TPA: quinone-dependent dihydroorotate dehydrogenase [Flavisolibacter sp.]|nr:quinone-dependent dihydroorotate dehydrogenase [Flavisolibacter sp.]
MYKILRKVLFLLPPEMAHTVVMISLKLFCSIPLFRIILNRYLHVKTNSKDIFGISFPNSVGLGAGFDKNAKYLRELQTLGFGFIEVGTVTPRPQSGNKKPRMFRLQDDQALINRMGFNNDGVDRVAKRLKKWRQKESKKAISQRFIIGGNIGKNKTTPNEEAWKDYEIAFRSLHPYVDFFVINVSSPNTPGLRELQDKAALRIILSRIISMNSELKKPLPVLLKIAPDLNDNQIDDVISLALEINLDGIVATNTTIERKELNTGAVSLNKMGNGGLSGRPLKNRSTEIVSYIQKQAQNKIAVIASGGIFTKEDAKEKINAGASLVEVWTGFIYEGPLIVRNICNNL